MHGDKDKDSILENWDLTIHATGHTPEKLPPLKASRSAEIFMVRLI